MADHHHFPHDLSNMATLAAWPTPVANDDNKTPEAHLAMKQRMGERDGTGANRTAITSLQVMAQLAGWKTPCVPNGGRISGNSEDIGKHRDGTKAQIGLENEAKLSGWTTPNTPSGGPNIKSTETHTGGLDLDGAATLAGWPTARAEDAESSGMRHSRGVADTLTAVVSLTACGTPAARDWKNGDARYTWMREEIYKRETEPMLFTEAKPC
jgi:hypothetical protein